jgi:hypothetical protein
MKMEMVFLSWGKFGLLYQKILPEIIVANIFISLFYLKLGFSLIKIKSQKNIDL